MFNCSIPKKTKRIENVERLTVYFNTVEHEQTNA